LLDRDTEPQGLACRPLKAPFGAEVLDVDLTQIDAHTAAALLAALAEYGLLLFRRQSLHDDEIYRFSAALGPVEAPPAAQNNCSPRFAEVIYLGNINSLDGQLIRANHTDHGAGGWHSDQTYRKRPATLSTLFCVMAPETGGETAFASARLGYEALPDIEKERVSGLRVRYRPGPGKGVPDSPVKHPAVLIQPASGRRSLYVTPAAEGFEGMAEDAGRALRDELVGVQLRPENIYRHRWRMGDMLVYDNSQFLHRREASAGARFLKATRLFANPGLFAVPD